MSLALTQVARMIERESGIVLKPAQLPSLQDAISRVDRNLTAESLLAQRASTHMIERLINEVTVRETFFFRHREELDAIDWHSLLAGARARGSEDVRVWVAGCASGEEAYTIAILACETFACASPPVRVLATDIATVALEQAVAGRYGERATRYLGDGIRERYFRAEGGGVSVGHQVRALVEFRRHNLVREPIPPPGSAPFDVVLCRNVLIYFDTPTVERVLGSLENALTPTGLLLLGAADRLSGALRGRSRARSGNRRHPSPARHPRPSGSNGRRKSDAPVRPSTPSRTATGPVAPPTPSRSLPAPPSQPTKRGPQPPASRPTIAEALKAADRGDLALAVNIAESVLAENPLECQAHYIRGVAEMARGNARAAIEPLRRALYVEPNFSLAAFKLARAHDELHEVEPARRTYQRTLRTLDHSAGEQATPEDRLDLRDIASSCRARLTSLDHTQ